MTNLEGKVVLVTGAGKGAGRLAAELFASQGARVAANDISPVNLDDLAASSPGTIRTYTEDVAKKVGVQSVINQVEDDLGPVDILINHAAVHPRVSLLDMDEWDWHRVLDVNLTGAFLAMQSVGRVMRPRGSGWIFNLISFAEGGLQQQAAYAASMHGLIALTLAGARELSEYGICVHALGRGLEKLDRADPSVPRDLQRALLYLCDSKLNGQIVNLEER
jgi:NAD(P)-dependent dehydrogenase (short-subunit alcohol dehydrogenase family)